MTTYYVSPTGNDSSTTGSEASPFKTIQHAADIVNPGDTVIVKDGTYTDINNDGYIIYLTRSGNLGNRITFKSENKWGAKLDGLLTTSDSIRIDDSNYVTFDGFEIKNMRGHAVLMYESNNLLLYRLYIHDIGQNNDTYEQSGEHSGIYGGTNNSIFDSILVHNIGHLHSIPMEWNDYNSDHGYYVAGDNNSIINNIFYFIESGWCIQITEGDNWLVSNNIMYGKNDYEQGGIVIVAQKGPITNTIIQNNIVYRLPSNSGYYSRSAIVDLYTWGRVSNLVIKNNLYYRPDEQIDILNQRDGDGSEWTAPNNILADPKFVDIINKNFHLQSTSPSIGKGTLTNAPDHDFDGNLRIGHNDIGAFQYTGTPPQPCNDLLTEFKITKI